MGVDPVSLGMMGVSMAMSAAQAAGQNKAAKAQAKIGQGAKVETEAMRAASMAQAEKDRATAEGQRAKAEGVWQGALPGVTREAQEAGAAGEAGKRMAGYEAAIAPVAASGVSFLPGQENAPALSKQENAAQLSKKLDLTRAMLKDRAAVKGQEDQFAAVNRSLGRTGEEVDKNLRLAKGTATMAGNVQTLANEGSRARLAQAGHANQLFQQAGGGQSALPGIIGGVAGLAGGAGRAGWFQGILPESWTAPIIPRTRAAA